MEHRLKKSGRSVMLTIPSYISEEDITGMLKNRVLNIYSVAEEKEDAKKVVYDDSNTPVFLTDKFLDGNDIKNAKIRRDRSSKFYLEIFLKEKIVSPQRIAFELDGSIIGQETLDTSGKISKLKLYTNMQYFDIQILRASLLQPLPSIELEPVIKELD